MTPLEPLKKALASPAFFTSDHGEIDCASCHGGNPAAGDKDCAHAGLAPRPSMTNPEGARGECHEEIAATAPGSLHATLVPFTSILESRADMDKWKTIDMGRERHRGCCHTGCGGCHVSRPENVDGGLVNGHVFNKPLTINHQRLTIND